MPSPIPTLGETPSGSIQPRDAGNSARTPRGSQPKGITVGPGDSVGAGDAYLVLDLLEAELRETAFEKVRDEVKWEVMHHRGESFVV